MESEMGFLTSSQRSTEKPSPLVKSSPMAADPSLVKATPSDQIATPEKRIQLPRRARKRSVAFSVREVQKIALTLQRPGKESADRPDLARPDDPLLSTEEKLRTDSGSDSISKALKAKTPVKLPEKYETLVEFFNSMESSIRLLRLKGSMSTFPNICTSIQHLTERRFTYGHLAQLKHILPEAISIKKVILLDETTCCMKPELQIALQTGTIGDGMKRKEGGGFSLLRRVFRERISDFSNKHPEGDDVPEETLPHPFNQTKSSLVSNMEREPTNSMHAAPLSNFLTNQQLVGPSHMPGSFRRRFSQNSHIPDEERTSLECLHKASPKDDHLISAVPHSISTSTPPIQKKSLLGSPIPLPSLSRSRTQEEETKKLAMSEDCPPEELRGLKGTPAKLISTPAKLMTSTPELQMAMRYRPTMAYDSPEIQTPKRYRPTMTYDSPPPKKLDKRSTRTKLFTTPKKNEKTNDEESGTKRSSVDKDVIGFLPENLLRSIREKERKALEERQAGVAEENRRQKLISSLHNIFDMILLIFQSRQSSIMTKQQLVHKIITSHCRIVDRCEVEEQLMLLQELVPDWISEKVASSGDILYCVNKMSSPEEIRQRLAEAE